MITRRRFVEQATAGVVGAVSARSWGAAGASPSPGQIKSVIRRDDTILRLGGDGDNFHMTWAADDRQLVAVCDGRGWSQGPMTLNNCRLWSIRGSSQEARFEEIENYPTKPIRDRSFPYHCYGTLALDGYIYQYLNAFFRGAKLIYSPDNGRTWCNQDGSTPVVWETEAQQSRKSLVFFNEPQHAFSLLTILQMGKNYEYNRDGHIYVYSPNGMTDGTMNELVMFRVPKGRILDRGAYEYFAGCDVSGSPSWIKDVDDRAVVHTFPRGWVNKSLHPYAWQPSVVYNAPLDQYLMANWGMGCAPNGAWFGKPSYLGFWTAPKPWGPWTQIYEEAQWMPGNDTKARAYQPQIAPKWIAPDGKSFWLVWTDFQHTSEFWAVIDKALATKSDEEFARLMERARRDRPYYSFNTQRVDLVLG